MEAFSPTWTLGTGKSVAWPVGVGGKGNAGVAGVISRIHLVLLVMLINHILMML